MLNTQFRSPDGAGSSAKVEVKPLQIDRILDTAIKHNASDIHLSPGLPPLLGLRGRLTGVNTEPLVDTQIMGVIRAMAPEAAQLALEQNGQADFSYTHPIKDGERYFRCNVTKVRGGLSGTFRLISNSIPTPDKLGINEQILNCVMRDKGLFLVTGQTGSGKSTTLASLVDYVTSNRAVKVITLEQPIEYVFSNKRDVGEKGAVSLVEQQDIPYHVPSFSDALRAAMRRAPNVIMVGELRDIDTMVTALQAAETGHLVLGTLHTNTSIDSISRIVNSAPESRINEIRTLLSTNLIGVMSQVLLRTADEQGRVMAYEFMYNTSAIAGKIRDHNKTPTILSDIQTGGKHQMQTLESHLRKLVEAGVVTEDEARSKAPRPDQFDQKAK